MDPQLLQIRLAKGAWRDLHAVWHASATWSAQRYRIGYLDRVVVPQ